MAIRCNYIGCGEAEFAARSEELAEVGVSVQPSGEDNYCWYRAGDEFIKPFEFPNGYAARDGDVYPESRYVYFNRGEPKDIPEKFRQYDTPSSNVEMAEFLTIEARDAGYLGDEDNQFSARETLLKYIKEEWPEAVVIDHDLRIEGMVENRRRYAIYIAGYDLPKTGEDSGSGLKIPDFTTAHCPEWVLHTEDVVGDIRLEGWEVTLSPTGRGEGEGGTYLAIPRQELKEDVRHKLGRTAVYEYDLRTKLGLNEFLKGDDPIRLITDVTFAGADGVAGLECPIFEVDILEIPKTEDNCLAWIERRSNEDIRAKRVKDGYIVPFGNGGYKYIAPTGKLDIEAAKEFIAKGMENRDGFGKWIGVEKVVDDPVCSAYELRPQYVKKIEIRKSAMEFLERGADGLADAYRRYQEREEEFKRVTLDDLKPHAKKTVEYNWWEEKFRKLEDMARRTGGRVHEWTPSSFGYPSSNIEEIIRNLFKEALGLKEKVDDYQIVFLVDASGSMGDDIYFIKENGGAILGFARGQVKRGGRVELGIRSFVDKRFMTWRPLRELEKNNKPVKETMDALYKEVGWGGVEPVWDAIVKAMREEEWKDDPNVKKKIVVIMDEPGDLTNSGYDEELVYAMARKMGIVVEIIRLPALGGGGCFTGDMLVMTEDGPMKMSKIYEMFAKGRALPQVATFNEEIRKIEYQVPDIAFEHARPNGVEILNVSESADIPPLEVTANHQMLVRENGEERWLEAGHIDEGLTSLFCAVGCEDDFEAVTENEPVFIQGARAVYNIHFNDVPGRQVKHNYLISPDGKVWFVAHNKHTIK